MIHLPNNCRCSEFSVSPANWNTVRASVKVLWYIKYRFYDDNLNQVKQVMIKTMNSYTSLKDRQEATRMLLEDEMQELKNKGFNRITKRYALEDEEISEHTPFVEALNYAYTRVKISNMPILKTVVKYITLAAEQKHYNRIPVKDIKRRHLVLLFEQVERIKGKKWSTHTYNSYRAYMGILYKELLKLDIVPANLPYLMEKKTIPDKIRETLTQEQRIRINNELYNNRYTFWRLIHIFFHSGSRETEILDLKKESVDLMNQTFRVVVKKGKGGAREEWRTISNIVLPLWQEIMMEAEDNQYLFSAGLQPGNNRIRTEQICRRWNVHVKKKMGITADFYSLKYTNLDEIAEQMGLKTAQHAAGHTSQKTTKIYAFGEDARAKKREHELLKSMQNKFA
jgi:integrase